MRQNITWKQKEFKENQMHMPVNVKTRHQLSSINVFDWNSPGKFRIYKVNLTQDIKACRYSTRAFSYFLKKTTSSVNLLTS